MNHSSEQYLAALGATQPLTPAQADELETRGYLVIHNVIDKDWLEEMRTAFDMLVDKEGDNLAVEHHQEATATRIANMINKGTVWEKVWSHPLILSVCHHIFGGAFKVSSLNGRERCTGAAISRCMLTGKSRVRIFRKSIWSMPSWRLTI